MSIYTPAQLAALTAQRTVFSALEGTVSFYAESDYWAGRTRTQMTLLGSHLFVTGLTVNDTRNMHPFVQPFGAKSKTLTAVESVESKLSIQSMLVATGDKIAWFAPGHPPLIAFVDYIADKIPGSYQPDDLLDTNGYVHQSVVLRNCICTGTSFTGADVSLIGWTLDFTCGELTFLANGSMDLP